MVIPLAKVSVQRPAMCYMQRQAWDLILQAAFNCLDPRNCSALINLPPVFGVIKKKNRKKEIRNETMITRTTVVLAMQL